MKRPSIIGDNMVIQRDAKFKDWGKADPGENVTVSILGSQSSATADSSGRWKVELPPLKVADKK